MIPKVSVITFLGNKAGYGAEDVKRSKAGAMMTKNRSPKGNMWSAIPVALL